MNKIYFEHCRNVKTENNHYNSNNFVWKKYSGLPSERCPPKS
jgi:hypothetical protein